MGAFGLEILFITGQRMAHALVRFAFALRYRVTISTSTVFGILL